MKPDKFYTLREIVWYFSCNWMFEAKRFRFSCCKSAFAFLTTSSMFGTSSVERKKWCFSYGIVENELKLFLIYFLQIVPPSNFWLFKAMVIFSFLWERRSKACTTLETARFETCTRLANLSSNSSLSQDDSCMRKDVVASLSSEIKN